MEKTNNYLLNIFTNKLYKYTNKTYINFIKDILKDENLKKYEIKNIYLDKFKKNITVQNELFIILENGRLQFLNEYNLIKFEYENKCKVNSLININIKNQKTYELIKTIESLQKTFFISNDLKDIRYISHDKILNTHKKLFNNYLSKPLISLILNNTKFKDKNNNTFKLSFLTPKKHFIQYIQIKYIINIYPFATDILLKEKLNKFFSTDISNVQISKVRKKYFIPNKYKRVDTSYERFEFYFTSKKILCTENLLNYKNIEAVYELVSNQDINYSYKSSTTIYIGSTKNLYKRLNEYINKKGHTTKIKNYFDNNTIYFRIIKTKQFRNLEILLLHDFKESYGELPLLNSNNS